MYSRARHAVAMCADYAGMGVVQFQQRIQGNAVLRAWLVGRRHQGMRVAGQDGRAGAGHEA
ncbi:hypothetical protein D3C78_1902910 [compost metagenome]